MADEPRDEHKSDEQISLEKHRGLGRAGEATGTSKVTNADHAGLGGEGAETNDRDPDDIDRRKPRSPAG